MQIDLSAEKQEGECLYQRRGSSHIHSHIVSSTCIL